MNKTKRIALMSALAAIALTIFVIESQIPPIVPIPGIKLGLSNIITLVTMVLLGRKEAGAVFTVRLILGAMFTGSVSSLLFSAAGGLCAYLLMCAIFKLLPENLLWVVSVLASLAHNAGQLVTAIWVSGTSSLLIYAPALIAAGIISGAFTGLAAMYLVRAIKKVAK